MGAGLLVQTLFCRLAVNRHGCKHASAGCSCTAANRGVPHCTGTKPLTAEGITVDLGKMCFVIAGNFPIPAPEAMPLLGCKDDFDVLTHPKVYLIKERQCMLVWLQV